MYTPIQVARRANAHPNSIRNWAREYAELLSEQTAGRRLFTDEDVEVLCAIAALRKSGVPPGEIADHIRNQAVPIVDVVLEENAQAAPQAPIDILSSVPIAYNALQGRMEALERRLETRDRGAIWWAWGMGLWMGIVLMGALFFAVWLSVNGPPW